ncbi:uncharacterized protein LOC143459087 isoform X1 [Clavelina lepadiformis]|uniref:uncharacterized protein LOC143459087 isoform X1 n=1 Tax=Clavelina lepadiformis TaxID=159417 RepID=UPI00404232A0
MIPIDFGYAPVEVVAAFEETYGGNLLHSLETLLKQRQRSSYIYYFKRKCAFSKWQMLVQEKDFTHHLKDLISRLDEFVSSLRLDSRAAALELLLSLPSQLVEIGTQTDDSITLSGIKSSVAKENQIINVGSNLKRTTSTQHLARDDKVVQGDTSREELFSCELCGKNFTKYTDIQQHAKTHRKDKSKTCSECGKTFSSCHSLSLHLRIHTGERPFVCETCGRSFVQRQDLENHTETHRGKKHICETCGKSFTLLRGLKEHLRSHTGDRPFVCEVCGRAYLRRCNLTEHMTLHTGAKPYKCKFCPKSFRKVCSKAKHERIHSGERPFKCDICKKGFTQKYNLSVHMKTHTKT